MEDIQVFDDCMKQILKEFNETPRISTHYLLEKLAKHSKQKIQSRLRRLLKNGMIKPVPNVTDMRRVFYRLATLEEYYSTNSNVSDDELRLLQKNHKEKKKT